LEFLRNVEDIRKIGHYGEGDFLTISLSTQRGYEKLTDDLWKGDKQAAFRKGSSV